MKMKNNPEKLKEVISKIEEMEKELKLLSYNYDKMKGYYQYKLEKLTK